MTKLPLKELEEIMAEATSEPWEVITVGHAKHPSINGAKICNTENVHVASVTRSADKDIIQKRADARLIAESRTALPNAIAVMREMAEALELAHKQMSALDDVLNHKNHEVFGWHLNGDGEPVENFFEENDYGAIEKSDKALSRFAAFEADVLSSNGPCTFDDAQERGA